MFYLLNYPGLYNIYILMNTNVYRLLIRGMLITRCIATKNYKRIIYLMKGGYPDLNRELTVPHTAALPFELHPPFYTNFKI